MLASQKSEFPIFEDSWVYLDSGASTQKPACVIEAVSEFYSHQYSNVHRGVYDLSARATERYEAVREKSAEYFGAKSSKEIIFTRGVTEGVNLVAYSWARKRLKPGDEVIVTLLEHHSNFVPWQAICEETGASFKVIGLTADGYFDHEAYRAALSSKTALVACTHLANAYGTVLPIAQMAVEAHACGARILVDAAQSAARISINVSELDVDFLVASSHKMYGPTGVGVLYAKSEIQDEMSPFMYGGDMIRSVSVEKTEYAESPTKFEAGTPNIAGVIGFGAALDYLSGLGLSDIAKHEQQLLDYFLFGVQKMPAVKVLGPADSQHGLVCFSVDGVHPHDLSQFLNERKIAVRAGHHCAQPLLRHFGLGATTRVSFGVYNDKSDVDAVLKGLGDAIEFFS